MFGAQLIQEGRLSSKDLGSFLLFSTRLQRSQAQLSILFGEVVKGLAASDRVLDILNHPSLPPSRTTISIPSNVSSISSSPTNPEASSDEVGTSKSHLANGTVEIKDVHFAYPTRRDSPVLTGFNLRMEGKQVTALVGSSGSGKSTVAQLLERLYAPQKGAIYLDGQDIATFDPKWLRQRVVAVVEQTPALFAGTIAENVRYGKLGATDEEVVAACRVAHAHEFISAFPLGYSTLLGERGVTLSGGQRQRLAIARAVLRDPRVLVLDEATAALDSHSERVVQQALDEVMQGRTTIVIAHRLSTIKDAHSIAAVKGGQVVEQGTHAQLTEKGGLYAKLVQYQLLTGQTTEGESLPPLPTSTNPTK